MLNNSLMRHMPPVMAAMVLSLLLQGVALAFSYDDIVMLVQAEKSQGLPTTSASLDERLAHLEEKVFGSPRVGSESKRLRDLCYKIGLLAPAVERFNSSIPGQAGPVVARKHTQVSSMVSSHQVPLQIALVKRPVQNQPCLVLPGISFTAPAAAQPATLNTTVAVRGTTGDTGACNLQHGTAMESVTGRAITAVPPQSEKTVYSPVKQAPVASTQPKDQSGDTPAVLWIISASAAASGLLIVAVIAMLLHRSTRIRALKSQWTRNVRQTSGGRNSGAHSKEATANTMGKSQNKQSKAAAAPAQRPGLNEQAPADSAPSPAKTAPAHYLAELARLSRTHQAVKTTPQPSARPRQTSPEQQLVGQILNGRYRLLELVGKGGMSVVYKAEDMVMGSVVAVKMLLPQIAEDQLMIDRFVREAKTSSKVAHRNVMQLFDYGQAEDGTCYIVIEYLDGCSMAHAMKATGAMTVERTIHIAGQICDALDDLHRKGIVHRDLKPSNIMLVERNGQRDCVSVVDFGLAKDSGESQRLTQTGEIFGSPVYMSPEQCRGEQLDGRSDIYSLGVLLYEALTGSAPLVGEHVIATINKHLVDAPNDFQTVRPDLFIPPRLEAVIMKALAKSPADRHCSMAEFKQELARSVPRRQDARSLRNLIPGRGKNSVR